MAQDSKKQRRLRRQRRQISLFGMNLTLGKRLTQMEQTLKLFAQQEGQTRMLLLGLLAQHGGELKLTKGTLDSVVQNIKGLNWETSPNPADANELVVRLVETEAAESSEQSEPSEEEQTDERTDTDPATAE